MDPIVILLMALLVVVAADVSHLSIGYHYQNPLKLDSSLSGPSSHHSRSHQRLRSHFTVSNPDYFSVQSHQITGSIKHINAQYSASPISQHDAYTGPSSNHLPSYEPPIRAYIQPPYQNLASVIEVNNLATTPEPDHVEPVQQSVQNESSEFLNEAAYHSSEPAGESPFEEFPESETESIPKSQDFSAETLEEVFQSTSEEPTLDSSSVPNHDSVQTPISTFNQYNPENEETFSSEASSTPTSVSAYDYSQTAFPPFTGYNYEQFPVEPQAEYYRQPADSQQEAYQEASIPDQYPPYQQNFQSSSNQYSASISALHEEAHQQLPESTPFQAFEYLPPQYSNFVAQQYLPSLTD